MKKRIYIIHGYAATQDDHWFQSTKQALQDENTVVSILRMPNPMQPDPDLWLSYLENNLTPIDADTIVVAHSLGVIAALKYLLTLRPVTHLKGLVLVSGFQQSLPELPQLNSFTSKQLDSEAVKRLADHRIMFVSENDKIVDPSYSIALAHEIDAELYIIKNGGHFLADDGFSNFSEVVEVIRSIQAS